MSRPRHLRLRTSCRLENGPTPLLQMTLRVISARITMIQITTSRNANAHVKKDFHCKWHPDTHSHATKDCRNPGSTIALTTRTTVSPRAPPSTTVVSKKETDLSKIQCYGCGKMGHYKPDCRNKSQWEMYAKSQTGKQGFKGKKVKARATSISWDSSVSADN